MVINSAVNALQILLILLTFMPLSHSQAIDLCASLASQQGHIMKLSQFSLYKLKGWRSDEMLYYTTFTHSCLSIAMNLSNLQSLLVIFSI